MVSMSSLFRKGRWLLLAALPLGFFSLHATIKPPPYISVTAGDFHTCLLQGDRTVTCFAANNLGQGVAPSGTFKQISAGEQLNCGVRSDNSVACWGWNDLQQAEAPLGEFTQVSAGYFFACGIRTDNTLHCWGRSLVPADLEVFYTQVSAGYQHACAVRSDGNIDCWGFLNDQLNQTDGPYIEVEASIDGTSCARRTNGSLKCWGNDNNGAATPPSGAFTSLSAGANHFCALRTDQTIACWGHNEFGKADAPAGTYLRVTAGWNHTCAIRTNGTLACWGNNDAGQSPNLHLVPVELAHGFAGQAYGQTIALTTANPADWLIPYVPVAPFYVVTSGSLPLGLSLDTQGHLTGTPLLAGEYTFAVGAEDANGFVGEREYALVIEPASANRIIHVATGWYNTCVLRASGALNCFGPDYGVGQNTPPPGPYKRIDMGDYHSCGILTNDTVRCWGDDFYGQSTPPPGAFKSLSAGSFSSCGIRSDDGVSCWGADMFGAATAPTGDFVNVSAGYFHGCGVRTDGVLDCWGKDFNGFDPVIDPAGQFSQVSVGVYHDCAVRDDGALHCWGRNDFGQSSPPPGQFQYVSVGNTHTCALDMDATITCWGFLDDVRYPQGVPTPPPGQFDQFDTGVYHMCGLRKDGSVACWGNDGTRAPILEVAPAMLGDGRVGTVYQQQFSMGPDITSGNYVPPNPTFGVVAGALPEGMSLSLDGLLSGTPIHEGASVFTVYATDANGIDAQREYTWIVGPAGGGSDDDTPPIVMPQVTGTLGESGWHVGTVTVSWSVVDDESAISQAIGCEEATLSTDTPGASFTCTATSVGGTTSETAELRLDATAPDTHLTETPPYFDDGEALFAFDGTDATSGVQGFECSLDGADYGTCDSPFIAQSLSRGNHVFSVRAFDAAGYRDASPAQHLWIVDGGAVAHDTVSAGFSHTCRIREDGTLACWGSNGSGQTTPQFGFFRQVDAGQDKTCALRVDGTITCFGWNGTVPAEPPPGQFVQVSAGHTHACAISVTGALACWGDIETPPPGLFVEVRSGANHACAIGFDGQVTCWGDNSIGEADAPGGTFVNLALGAEHSCGLRTDRTVACWGRNDDGQVTPPSGTFKRIYSQYLHNCGIRDDDTLTCWGHFIAIRNIPTGEFTQVAPGGFHTCGIRTSGELICAGANNVGQAPRPTIQPATLPSGSTGIAYLQALSMADGTVYAAPDPVLTLANGSLPGGLDLTAEALSGTPTNVETANFTIAATDANGFQASRAYALQIAQGDSTAPVITPTMAGTQGTNDWYRGSVVVTWTVADAESAVTATNGCETTSLASDTTGVTLTCEAISGGGTATESVTIKIDRAAPSLAPSTQPDPLLLNSLADGIPGATDATSGVAVQACGDLLTATVGARQVQCSATDMAGNTATANLAYHVVYGFTNLNLLPPPSANRIASGKQTVLSWRLVDANGAPITNLPLASVENPSLFCSSTGVTIQDAPISTGNVKLQNLGNGNYALNWKVPRVKAMSCLAFDLVMGDNNNPRIHFLLLK
jgi:alpha-tubulin suppressor-like RCC1 family protein